MSTSKFLPLSLCLAALTLSGCSASHHDHHPHGSAEFIAHAAVMVESGPTKILFDPIFDKDYGSFQLVAPETQNLMMGGQPPFDGVDAVFVSHAHGVHVPKTVPDALIESGADYFSVQGEKRELKKEGSEK